MTEEKNKKNIPDTLFSKEEADRINGTIFREMVEEARPLLEL